MPLAVHSSSEGQTASLIRRYDRPGPRYTSYPTALEFNQTFDEAAYKARLRDAAADAASPLSLYVHLPFCAARCSYCGCMAIITKNQDVIERYLEHVETEIALLARHLGRRRRVVQLHWGGGTPTSLSLVQITRLYRAIGRAFEIEEHAEKAIEIDPRVTTREQLLLLRALGFNRLSMGVQDFSPEVQQAIGRRQSEFVTRGLYDYARQIGFESINLDLVYGLPLQTREAFEGTLATTVAMAPDRVAIYSYAHVPWLRPHQKQIPVSSLPDAALKFELIGAAVDAFHAAGYVSIGMDHFARPDDDLAVAARQRRLHRNFMGYTTCLAPDTVGVGVSAIGEVGGAFAQNVKQLSAYAAALDAGRFPIERGYALDCDDRARRHVITQLMCNLRVDCRVVDRLFGIEFSTYFKRELDTLQSPGGPVDDGFLCVTPDALEVTPRGRLFVRTICMTFDRYLATHNDKPVFSRTI